MVLGLLVGGAACGGTVDVFGADGGGGMANDDDGGLPLPTGGATTGATGGADASGGASTVTSGGVGGASSTGSGGAPSTGSGGAPSTSGVTVGPSSSASSGGGPVCDNTGVCDNCVSCAWNGPCQGYAQACLANPECVAIMQCYQQCNQPDCTTPCWIPHPAGQADYLAASICVTCDNCYADCDGGQVGCPEN